MHVDKAPPRPSALVDGVDPRLEAICLKALSKKPADRYAGAREMRAELRSLAGVPPSSDPAVPASTRVLPKGERMPIDVEPLSSAATLLAVAPLPAPAAAPVPTALSTTSTQPSAGQIMARKKRRWFALLAIALAVVLLRFLAR